MKRSRPACSHGPRKRATTSRELLAGEGPKGWQVPQGSSRQIDGAQNSRRDTACPLGERLTGLKRSPGTWGQKWSPSLATSALLARCCSWECAGNGWDSSIFGSVSNQTVSFVSDKMVSPATKGHDKANVTVLVRLPQMARRDAPV